MSGQRNGAAHTGARVLLSPLATLFVFGVIFAGPLAGLALLWRNERLGSWVSHVDSDWRALFTTTAALLAVLEAAGTGLAIQFARERTAP